MDTISLSSGGTLYITTVCLRLPSGNKLISSPYNSPGAPFILVDPQTGNVAETIQTGYEPRNGRSGFSWDNSQQAVVSQGYHYPYLYTWLLQTNPAGTDLMMTQLHVRTPLLKLSSLFSDHRF